MQALAATTRVLLAAIPNFRRVPGCTGGCASLQLGRHGRCAGPTRHAEHRTWRAAVAALLSPQCLLACRAAGEGLVRACAEAGTHYFDLSIETDLHAEVWR